MGFASSVASFALSLMLLSPVTVRAETTVESQVKTATRSTTDSYSYSVGMSYWEETYQLAGPNERNYNITAVNWALALGVQRQIQRGYWGWLFDAQALIGQNEGQSTDPTLQFFNNRQSLLGGLIGFGIDHEFEPGVRLAFEAGALYRHIALSAPDGYSLNRFADNFDSLLRIEMTFPITQSLLATQQLGYSFVTQDILWMVGIRL